MQENNEKKEFQSYLLARCRQGNYCPKMQDFRDDSRCRRIYDPKHCACNRCPRRPAMEA